MEPRSPTLQADSLPAEPSGKPGQREMGGGGPNTKEGTALKALRDPGDSEALTWGVTGGTSALETGSGFCLVSWLAGGHPARGM